MKRLFLLVPILMLAGSAFAQAVPGSFDPSVQYCYSRESAGGFW